MLDSRTLDELRSVARPAEVAALDALIGSLAERDAVHERRSAVLTAACAAHHLEPEILGPSDTELGAWAVVSCGANDTIDIVSRDERAELLQLAAVEALTADAGFPVPQFLVDLDDVTAQTHAIALRLVVVDPLDGTEHTATGDPNADAPPSPTAH